MTVDVKEREVLFTFWHDLPVMKQVETPQEEVFAHEARLAICKFLREGKEESFKGTTRRRYGFKAKELLDHLVDSCDIKLSLQSLYFHLQKLEEFGLTTTITIIREGKHNSAYIGRTARVFLFMDVQAENKKYRNRFSEASKLDLSAGNEEARVIFNNYVARFLDLKREQRERISEILVTNEEILTLKHVDLAQLFGFLELLSMAEPEMVELLREVKSAIRDEFWL